MAESPAPGKILVVVDPAQDELHALNRAIITTEMYQSHLGTPKPELNVFLSVDVEHTDTSVDNDKICRDNDWFNAHVLGPLQSSELSFTIGMSWSTDWYGSILKQAKDIDAGLIILPMIQKFGVRDRIFNESLWRLCRTSPCPVLMVRPGAAPRRKTTLAAVNIQSHKPEYQRLNDLIIERAAWLSEGYGAELHLANAYEDSMDYPDRGELAKRSGIDTANIHVKSGSPHEVIADVAKDIKADIVVLGTQNRYNRWRGNTSERIITELDCDILTIN